MFDLSHEFRVQKLASEVMKLMEAKGLSIAEAEEFPEALRRRLKENGERIEKSKPFTVHQDFANPSGTP